MKTIKERAKEWVDSLGAGLVHPYNRQAMIDAYIAGAKAQYEELTRWHDPKEELPEYYKVVEVKWYGSGLIRISTAWLSAGDAGGYLWTIEGTSRLINVKNILGWREIQE